jgi:hypothetical protein
MPTCITHTRTRVSRFTRYYHVTCDLRWSVVASWHDVFNEQFIFCPAFFYWLILPHLDCHVNHDWLHVERFHGAVPGIWADQIWDGLGPSIYTGDVLYTRVFERFIRLSENWLTFCTAVSLSCRSLVRRAVDRGRAVSPNRRGWSETCTGASESGFWKVSSHDRSRSSFHVFFIDDFFIYSCTGSTVSRSPSCSWYNDDLMDRSVVTSWIDPLSLFIQSKCTCIQEVKIGTKTVDCVFLGYAHNSAA